MLQKVFVTTLTTILLIACSENHKHKETNKGLKTNDNTMVSNSIPSYKDIVFDSKKDLVCSMPVKEGVSDTAHYKGKVFGFCAKECKEEFLKTPASYLATK